MAHERISLAERSYLIDRVELLKTQLEADNEELRNAAALGDLRENTSYETAKNAQTSTEAELREAQARLTLPVVDAPPSRIGVGSRIKLTPIIAEGEKLTLSYQENPNEGYLHNMDGIKLSQIINVTSRECSPNDGLIPVTAEIISQVLGREYGIHTIVNNHGEKRTYDYAQI